MTSDFVPTARDEALETVGFRRVPGAIQILTAVWIPGKGYLASKRSMIYGGHHGEQPMITDLDKAEAIVGLEVRGSLRALAHRYAEESGEK